MVYLAPVTAGGAAHAACSPEETDLPALGGTTAPLSCGLSEEDVIVVITTSSTTIIAPNPTIRARAADDETCFPQRLRVNFCSNPAYTMQQPETG